MPFGSATALAHPNIALIKYWGNRDTRLRLPSNGSISMNLDGLFTQTRVTFDPTLAQDEFSLNDQITFGAALWRVSELLDRVRDMAGMSLRARVISSNNFPTGAGIASSASAFAALSLAASQAAGSALDERQLSRLARTASGSACRSVPGGFAEWQAGEDDGTSFGFSIAPPEHWALVDCVTVVNRSPKAIGSTTGHALAETSPLQVARVADAPRRLDCCRRAILERDFAALAAIVELDSNWMHAVMMTGAPAVLYWEPATITVMLAVATWRKQGLPVCYTVDAGPNVHVISLLQHSSEVSTRLSQLPGVQQVLTAQVGGSARLI